MFKKKSRRCATSRCATFHIVSRPMITLACPLTFSQKNGCLCCCRACSAIFLFEQVIVTTSGALRCDSSSWRACFYPKMVYAKSSIFAQVCAKTNTRTHAFDAPIVVSWAAAHVRDRDRARERTRPNDQFALYEVRPDTAPNRVQIVKCAFTHMHKHARCIHACLYCCVYVYILCELL